MVRMQQRASPTAYSLKETTLASIIMEKPLPRLVAFDLDYTLWHLWVDTHISPPLKRTSPNALNSVVDRYGTPLKFYPGVPSILHRLHESQIHIAAASRTCAPDLARDALALLLVPPPKNRPNERPQRAIDFFESLEIYPGSKRTHFGELHKATGIPYSEMASHISQPKLKFPCSSDLAALPLPCLQLFFDDEERNREVENLGVTFVLVKGGMNEDVLEEGLRKWRKNRGLPEDDDEDDEYDDDSDERMETSDGEASEDGSGSGTSGDGLESDRRKRRRRTKSWGRCFDWRW